MEADNKQVENQIPRGNRTECFSYRSEKDGQIPVWVFTDHIKGVLPALMINISESGCCLLVNKKDRLPSVATMEFYSEGKELTRIRANIHVVWEKEDYSIKHHAVGIELDIMDTGDHANWLELAKTIEANNNQYVRSLIKDTATE